MTSATAARLASPRSRLADLATTHRRESGLFVLGVVVIAVHVLDDSFLQPSPGTSAGDHLLSGLIPLAVLALVGKLPTIEGNAAQLSRVLQNLIANSLKSDRPSRLG